MDMQTKPELDYGNWVRKKQLTFLGGITLALAVLAVSVSIPIARLVLLILALLSFITFLVPLYAYVMCSQSGGKFQQKVYDQILQHTGSDFAGKALDIGAGNGVLAVLLALRHPRAQVTGVDYWGEDWEYSRSVCEKNAQAAGVADRLDFQKGDAAKLVFGDGEFGLVVSNLTFHEVKSAADKRRVLQEALRLVSAGGNFAFIDYFFEEKYYGETDEFKVFLSSLGLKQATLLPLREVIQMPKLLLHPKVFGRVGLLYGER